MHVVVVGDDMGAVRAALELSRSRVEKVTLLSTTDYLQYDPPLLDAARARALDVNSIDFKKIFARHPAVRHINDTVRTIDAERKLIRGTKHSYNYDTLIISRNTPPSHVRAEKKLHALIATLATDDAAERTTDTEVVIVGHDLIAVEVAVALQRHGNSLLSRSRSRVRVSLVTPHKEILPDASRQCRLHVTSEMNREGVGVKTDTHVRSKGADRVEIDGLKIPDAQVVYLDVQESDVMYASQSILFELNDMQRVKVSPHLEAYEKIYAIGGATNVEGAATPLAMLDMADYTVDRIVSSVTSPYSPSSSIYAVSISPHWAYVECFGVYVKGMVGAWAHRALTRSARRKVES